MTPTVLPSKMYQIVTNLKCVRLLLTPSQGQEGPPLLLDKELEFGPLCVTLTFFMINPFDGSTYYQIVQLNRQCINLELTYCICLSRFRICEENNVFFKHLLDSCSVDDPGCFFGSRIRLFPSRIRIFFYPGSTSKNLSTVFLAKKNGF